MSSKATELGWISSFRVASHGEELTISHILFTNDTIIFYGDDVHQLLFLYGAFLYNLKWYMGFR